MNELERELYEALAKLMTLERRRYGPGPEAEHFYQKEHAQSLAALAKARGE